MTMAHQQPDQLLGAREPTAADGEFAQFVHQYLREQIAFADQKAAFVFAGTAALLAYLRETQVFGTALRSSGPITGFARGSAVLAIGALIATALLALVVVFPRLRTSNRDGLVFWAAVRRAGRTQDEYMNVVRSLDSAATREEVARHAYDLAGIAQRKYSVLRLAILFGIASFGLVLAHVIGVRPTP